MPHEPLVRSDAVRPAEQSIAAIAALEQEALEKRTRAERLSDAFTRTLGRLSVVVFHVVWFASWCVVNLSWIPGVRPFDPFPFGILTLIVSSEGVFLAIFILISQNRMQRQADLRAHLTLQVSLLAERETTKVLQMLTQLSAHFGLKVVDDEAQQLTEATDVPTLVEQLKTRLPGE